MHTAHLSTVCKSTYPTLNFRKSRNKFLNYNNSVTQKVAILTFHAVLSLCNPDWTSTQWGGQIVTFCHIIHNKQSNLPNHQTTNYATIYKMPHLHLSSLVTKKKIETVVIFFHSTSRLCTYPYLAHLLYIIKCVPHCPVHTPPSAPPPTAHLSIPPQHPIRRTPRQQERTSRQERQARQQNTPRRLTQHPPPAANHPSPPHQT